MTSTIRAALFCVCLVSAARGQDLLVPVFDKPIPETRRDLLTIQRAATEVAKRAIPCTVGLQLGGALGSGVVVSEDGYILTAAHVVSQPGRDVVVRFPDGKKARAKSLGLHTSADGALVKITDEGPWPHLELIEKRQAPEVGDWCLALGHPGGFDADRAPPVRLGRVINIASTVIRTDCPITGGDSGGPLLDMQGRVIGIHSRITESMTENYHVPALAYREAWDKLKASELFPEPIASRFLALLDKNNDGRLTKTELTSRYHRRVFDRLVDEFELDVDTGIEIDELASETFKWRKATRAPLMEIEDLSMDNIGLSSGDFVRGDNMERLFANTLTHADEVTTRVYADGRFVALGTIVDADGLVLTKASRLNGEPFDCLLSDGRRLPADLVARDDGYDLALLRINATDLTTPDWNDSPLPPGTWVGIPKTAGRVESLGVVGVGPRRIREMQPLLGVRLDQSVVNEALIQEVVDRSGADQAGLEKGDVILNVADQDVFSTEQIRKILREFRAGDSVRITIRRGGESKAFDVLLLSEADNLFNSMGRFQMNGRLSRRRDGFESAFQIDAIVQLKHCGGPVVDVDGRVVGITLARADRVASYAINHRDLIPVLERLRKRSDVFQAKATSREVD